MSFRDPGVDSYGFAEEIVEDGVAESTIRDGLVNLQTSVRNVDEQISRLALSEPTPRTVSIMKTLLGESASRISVMQESLKQWRNSVCDDSSAMRRKLVFPKFEDSFLAEVEKFHRSQETVNNIEKRLDASSSDMFSLMRPDDASFKSHSSQMVQFSPFPPSSDIDELTDLPLDQFLATEQQLVAPVGWLPDSPSYTTSGQRSPTGLPAVVNRMNNPDPLGRSGLAPPPVSVGRNFYDHADDDEAPDVRKVMSSSSSTATGGSGSPISDEDAMRSHPSTISSNSTSPDQRSNRVSIPVSLHTTTDDFLEDDYLYQSHRRLNTSAQDEDDEDDDEELSGLLSRGSARSASYLDGWNLTVDRPRQDDELHLYVSRERLRGVHRIKAQLSQAAQVFRELAHLINEQQDDLDLIDSNMVNIKSATGAAVDELRKANILKQKARRRSFFMIFITLVIGIIVLFVYSLQGSSPPPLIASRSPSGKDVVVDHAQVVNGLQFTELSTRPK